MITNRELVSRVVSGARALTKDGAIRWRYVLGIARTKAKFLITQKLDELTLFKEEGIKSTIPCFAMKRVKTKDCGIIEFKLCNWLMKSCCKLPDVLFSKNGPGVLRVTNVDGSETYTYITANEYTRLKKRKYINPKSRYFTVVDGYLYAMESRAELLEVVLIAIDKDLAEAASSCCDDGVVCRNAWDAEFVCPERFLDLIVQDTISEIANYYRTSVSDANPNLDENQKTQTIP